MIPLADLPVGMRLTQPRLWADAYRTPRPVAQFDDHGLLRVWPSAREAARALGVAENTIGDAARRRKRCAGYWWEYDERDVREAVRQELAS
jgi:hypothetical protein